MSQKVHLGLPGIERDAAAYGIMKIKRNGVDQAVHWQVTCAMCGEVSRVPSGTRSPPELLAKHMRQKKWELKEGKAPKCPSCSNPRKGNDMNKPLAQSETEAPSALQMPGKILRAVYALLDDHLDPEKMLYRNGWTDGRIAKESGVAEVAITKIREESYGKLSEDPEVTSLKDDLKLMSMEIADTHTKTMATLTAFGQRIERIAAGRKV